ncbi:5714_t:CDS:2, partial [Racocetra persica]
MPRQQIGTNTEFPENINIPDILKVPDGNAFKFVLYGIGATEYRFNKIESTWNICNSEVFYVNYPEDLSFGPNSFVAKSTASGLDQSGNTVKNVLKSIIHEDMSLCISKTINIAPNPKPRLDFQFLSQVA